MTHIPLTDNEIKSSWYKYAGISGTDSVPYALKNLKENTLYFQSPSKFNDLYDCKMIIEQFNKEKWDSCLQKWLTTIHPNENQEKIDEDLEKIKVLNNHQRIYENLSEKYVNTFNELGIMCLTGSHTDILMWAHYGEKNSGICLEINLELCIQTIKNKGIVADIGHVSYIHEIPEVKLMEMYKSDNQNAALEEAQRVIFSKNNLWEYEKEIRISIPRIKEQVGGDVIQFPEGIYKSVIIGAKCELESDAVKQIKNVLSNKQKKIPLFQIVPSEQEYNLELKRLDY